MELTDGQKAFCSVAYDGEEIRTDLERKIFGAAVTQGTAHQSPEEERGRQEEILEGVRPVVDGGRESAGLVSVARRRTCVAVCGARAGKSYVLIALRLLWGCLVRDLSSLAAGQRAIGLVVAPDLRLAREVISYVRGALQSRQELKALIIADSQFTITLARPDGRVVSVEALPATRGGGAVRGRSLVDAALDECAFFRDEGYAVNDSEIYKAVAPRVLPGGQIILASTPWGESGLLHDMWKAGSSEHVLVGHAPTSVLHDSTWTREIIAAERVRDPENARREFDAEFMASGAGTYFDGNAIRAAVSDYELGNEERNDRWRYSVGVDFGFKSDSSALVVCRWDGERYRVVELTELRPSPDHPLVPSEVVREFSGIARRYGVKHVIADGHYREAIAEHLRASDLDIYDAPTGHSGKVESYARARAVLHEGRCEIPACAERLVSQLRAVIARPTSGGSLSIVSPRKPGGGHGDLASAWVLAVHHLATAQVGAVKPIAPKLGSPEYVKWWAEKTEKESLEHDLRKYGKRGTDDW